MKKIMNLFMAVVLFAACSSDKLDRQTALKLLQDKKAYPKVLDEEIYTADPQDAKRILDSGLEKEGLLKVQRTQKLVDIGSPLISFTDKAKPYLLPVSNEDKKSKVQRVKIAEEVLEEISGIQMLDGEKRAVVEYKTSFKDITPFSPLSTLKLNEKNTRKAYFSLYDDGWRLEENSGLEFPEK
ncbi:hypothetical protein SAMN05421813_13142 [Daejeonella rubra]|uniref:Uncharacterized protein n=1 Tax=Daejeonella rubra TaxID=990371 RepID=A0A1G9XMC6_9SPHI|nr:hypothetical protein [Daejeonella rubra]SDM97982.1 hypothetical protein SAMN05421813_13142 [Daejeonella rubra]